MLQLAFADRLAFCPNEGFRTPKTTLPFKLLEGFRGRLVEWRRGWDSNPRYAFTYASFQACALNHSATSPDFDLSYNSLRRVSLGDGDRYRIATVRFWLRFDDSFR